MNKKATGMMMTIMLVAACGWVAAVVLVIKPSLWLGLLIIPLGGIAIGLGICFLIWRWWFKRGTSPAVWDLSSIWPDVKRISQTKLYMIGSVFQIGPVRYLYGRAGEDLQKGMLVESDLAGRLVLGEPLPEGKEINELIYGDLKAAHKVDKYGKGILGWPQVDVKKYQYFWLEEPPLGTRFEMKGARAIHKAGD
ncbi:hypothetical protein LCGC14_2866530 [marine sediment metagenome]|uniref:Uncharacterized protein n=1 Tax=marine sediment metagenome TaxID=412755 RepID=A0A0F9ACC3_9ZZZZ